MNDHSRIALIAAGALMLPGGCAPRDLHARPEPELRAQIRQAIPPGTSINEAETLLTSRGYSCARSGAALSCIDRGVPAGSLVEHVWRVQLTHGPDARVLDIDANISKAIAL